MNRTARWLAALVVCAALATTASAAKKEEYLIYTPDGVILEWKLKGDNPPELKIKKLDKKSDAARLGYRKKDEIIAIGEAEIGQTNLFRFLEYSAEAETFRIRRKNQELELPAFFRTDIVLGGFERGKFKPGERAPTFKTKEENREHKLPDELAGQVVLINFWAVWCKPCLEEMPELVRLEHRYRSRGFTVLSVNIDDEAADMEKYLQNNPLPFVLVHSPGFRGGAARRYGVKYLPSNFLVDRPGRVMHASSGYAPGHQEELLAEIIEALLQEEFPILVVSRK